MANGIEKTFAQLHPDFEEGADSQQLLAAGTIIGGVYEIVRLKGQGGMGDVYLAVHNTLHKKCAVKLIPPDKVTPTSWERFKREAKSIARLDHQNIVKVTDLGIHADFMPFYAMEFVAGSNLTEIIEESGPLEAGHAIDIFKQICHGLGFAHRAGIVHRDLKPSNIMVVDKGAGGKPSVKILDFGLAKLTAADREQQSLTAKGEIFGSPYYMSPEQCSGTEVDLRSDLYSLGCTLFECLAGVPPFQGNISAAVMFSQQEAEPPRLSSLASTGKLPPGLEEVVARLLRKKPGERYQTAAELLEDLEKIEQGKWPRLGQAKQIRTENGPTFKQATPAIPATPATPAKSEASLKTTSFIIAGLVASLGAGALCVWLIMANPFAPSWQRHIDGRGWGRPEQKQIYKNGSANERVVPLTKEIIGESTIVYDNSEKQTTEEPSSSNDTTPYSTIIGHNKIFAFPNDTSIGTITTSSFEGPARGRIRVPRDAEMTLEPSREAIAFPNYLRRFRPGEITGFSLAQPIKINEFIHALAKMPGWEKIDYLRFMHTYEETLDKESLAAFARIKNLRIFVLDYNQNLFPMDYQFAFLKNATRVTIRMNTNPDKVVRHLKDSKNLAYLEVSESRLTPETMKLLGEMKTVRTLRICNVREAPELGALAGCKSLTHIKLDSRFMLNNGTAEALASMPALQDVYFTNAAKYSGLYKKLQKQLPKLRFSSDDFSYVI